MNYFLNMDDGFMISCNVDKVLIGNSYMNEKTCGSPEIPERGKYHLYWRPHLPVLLNTTKKKGLQSKNMNTKTTSVVGKFVKN